MTPIGTQQAAQMSLPATPFDKGVLNLANRCCEGVDLCQLTAGNCVIEMWSEIFQRDGVVSR